MKNGIVESIKIPEKIPTNGSGFPEKRIFAIPRVKMKFVSLPEKKQRADNVLKSPSLQLALNISRDEILWNPFPNPIRIKEIADQSKDCVVLYMTTASE